MDWSALFSSALRVLVAGLVFGAALPAIFALGVRMWAVGTDDVAPDGTVTRGKPLALAGSWIAFAVVGLAVLLGILWITQKSLHHYFGITVFGS